MCGVITNVNVVSSKVKNFLYSTRVVPRSSKRAVQVVSSQLFQEFYMKSENSVSLSVSLSEK